MKTSKLFLAITAIMVAFGCAKIETPNTSTVPINSKGEYAIVLSQSNQTTKAVANSTSKWHYDDFSLYTWNSNNEVIMNPFTVVATGTDSYDYDGVGTQTRQYFKNSADSYSFIGVIPPITNATLNNGSVTVGVESFVVDDNRVSGTLTADSPKEFLWAYANVEKANYGQTVTLLFQHGNALLYLGFISNDGNTKILDYTPETPAVTETVNEYQFNESGVFYRITNLNYATQDGTNTVNGSVEEYSYPLAFTNEELEYMNTTDLTMNRVLKVWKDKGWSIIKQYDPAISKIDTISYLRSNFRMKSVKKLISSESSSVGQYEVKAIAFNLAQQSQIDSKVSTGNFYQFTHQSTTDMTITSIEHEISPAIPGLKGIRVFSAQTDATDGYAHLPHTKTADATVATGLTFDNRVAVNDSIQFSLPTGNIPVYTGDDEGAAAQAAVYSPTTFYAIPGDTGLTHFVVKLSYTYKGTTVYDVRVPIELPAAGLEAGKYYKYIINITSIANGTNDPDEANGEKDDIDITKSPIKVAVDVTDYTNGHTKVITI